MNRLFSKPRIRLGTGTPSRTPAFVLCVLCLCAGGARTVFADEIDRVLAAVNGKVITESDLRMARNLNTLLMFGKKESGGERTVEEEISRLIDLELIRQELESFPLEAEEQKLIDARVEELKGGYAEIGGIAPIMRRLELQPDELQSYLRLQASILRFVNQRFRPFVSVAPEEVEAYYRDKLLPRLRQEKSPIPLLDKVKAEIENVLKEEKVNAALDEWITEIRSHSRIEYFTQEQTAAMPGAGEERRDR